MAKITVNGQPQEVKLPLTVEQLIRANNVAQPDMVSVQLNEEFLGRQEFSTRQVQEGDEVEFLYFMGGGQNHPRMGSQAHLTHARARRLTHTPITSSPN